MMDMRGQQEMSLDLHRLQFSGPPKMIQPKKDPPNPLLWIAVLLLLFLAVVYALTRIGEGAPLSSFGSGYPLRILGEDASGFSATIPRANQFT